MSSVDAEEIQSRIENPIDAKLLARPFAAILGDRPSKYAKSPSIWNPTLRALAIDAVYLPFDVIGENLPRLVAALRRTSTFLGGNVTVPHKIAVLEFLDEVDPTAKLIGAVNTIVRTPDGGLIGYNTDGVGGLDALVRPGPGSSPPFLRTIVGSRVLLLGAGGAARALAFSLADAIGSHGTLTVVNRGLGQAEDLAASVNRQYGNASFDDIVALRKVAPRADLIVNATTCGQSGLRSMSDGRFTCLEPYSPLAAANPAVLGSPADGERAFYAAWNQASQDDIAANQAASFTLLCDVPSSTAVLDIVYSPPETTLLRHARLTGHRTLNGKAMNINQAVAAFLKVMASRISMTPGSETSLYESVQAEMARVW